MGWFSIGNDDVIGDLPADTIAWALKQHRQEHGQCPNVLEVLQALETVLRGHEQKYLDASHAGRWPIGRLAFRQSVPSASVSPPPGLVDALQGALEGMVTSYETAMQRKPRLTEVLANFTFAMQGDPTSCLREAEGLELKKGDLTEVSRD